MVDHGYTGHIDPTHQGHYVSHPDVHPIHIERVDARQILDSRGYPTVAVTMHLGDGAVVTASAPAGASTGAFEAAELRDDGPSYSGRSVHRAVSSVTEEISPLLSRSRWSNIREVDDAIGALDGTENLARLGANAVVAVSIATARAFAHAAEVPLHVWIARVTDSTERMPVPHFNVLNGGAHAANPLEFQEFMIAPVGAAHEEAAVEAGAEIYHALAARVKAKFHTAGLGDEGGFAPDIASPEEAMTLLVAAIQDAGYTPGLDDVAIAIDPAANGFYERDGQYKIAGNLLSRDQLVDYYLRLLDEFPLRSIEDGFAEDDHQSWKLLFDAVGDRTQLVGDDLYVTDMRRIADGAKNRYSNAALIKPNQIGTVTGTLDAIETAKHLGMQAMVSHRSGETLDTFIADLVVGTGVGQIKSGAPARGERVAKYNRLTEIEAMAPRIPYGLLPIPTPATETVSP
ncbi:phosphopyruvate hydratase [Leifsonia sp. PS1209]|uniref:phosphopyruvate hydratase n=1 Tax=Leifsonia sp. PS1209 TaxID=2724914 RepID=UPI001442AD04|nr:phosphopyruvate hydratase [Leifsonia sp. PS1209]QIZ99840.1 phosphopyruvate hydratase [Leifsonia sp. PS1209]